MPRNAYHAVYELAADQHGVFSARQARGAGIDPMAVVMMERRGVVERLQRGVYRLTQFPYSLLAQYVEAMLWPSRTVATVSHESALALFGVSDVSPSRIHITVPTRFRIRRQIPASLRVHHADLGEGDVLLHDGVRVTTPSRTVKDCHAAHLGPDLIAQAIAEFTTLGYLTTRDADALRAVVHA